jgi:2-amino-4-hydroxy-6-hydroxymethyldihydropteridine diphosphokinase
VTPARAFVGLGANLGDPRAAVEEAMVAIGRLPGTTIAARSSLYRSAPIDAGGPDYVNAVVDLRTSIEPLPLLRALLAIEKLHGRQRSVRNAPRTLDLDLLLWGDVVIQTPELTLPHPRLQQRAFVLKPLAEIAPGLLLPGLGSLDPWLAAVADQTIEVMSP